MAAQAWERTKIRPWWCVAAAPVTSPASPPARAVVGGDGRRQGWPAAVAREEEATRGRNNALYKIMSQAKGGRRVML